VIEDSGWEVIGSNGNTGRARETQPGERDVTDTAEEEEASWHSEG
jgi:hypothetical protein